MPVSISLGLTVLTFLFTMTTVPIESVAWPTMSLWLPNVLLGP